MPNILKFCNGKFEILRGGTCSSCLLHPYKNFQSYYREIEDILGRDKEIEDILGRGVIPCSDCVKNFLCLVYDNYGKDCAKKVLKFFLNNEIFTFPCIPGDPKDENRLKAILEIIDNTRKRKMEIL